MSTNVISEADIKEAGFTLYMVTIPRPARRRSRRSAPPARGPLQAGVAAEGVAMPFILYGESLHAIHRAVCE